MQIKNFIGICIFLSLAHPGIAWSKDSNQQTPATDVCVKIQERYKNKTLEEIQVGKYPSYFNQDTPQIFSADIDNDGDDETFKYFNTRTYAYVAEVKGDKVIGLPLPSEGTDFYDGNAIIKYNGKYLQYHGADGPFEVQELTKKELDPALDERPIYNVKTICNYHNH